MSSKSTLERTRIAPATSSPAVKGLMLVLVWPLVTVVTLGLLFFGLPQGVGVPASMLVLALGMALVWRAPAAEPARGFLAVGAVLATILAVGAAVVPALGLGLAPGVFPLEFLLVSAALVAFAWGMRRWLRELGAPGAAVWWTVYALLTVVFFVVHGPLGVAAVDAAGLTSAVVGVALTAVIVAELIVHVGACISGIRALRSAR